MDGKVSVKPQPSIIPQNYLLCDISTSFFRKLGFQSHLNWYLKLRKTKQAPRILSWHKIKYDFVTRKYYFQIRNVSTCFSSRTK